MDCCPLAYDILIIPAVVDHTRFSQDQVHWKSFVKVEVRSSDGPLQLQPTLPLGMWFCLRLLWSWEVVERTMGERATKRGLKLCHCCDLLTQIRIGVFSGASVWDHTCFSKKYLTHAAASKQVTNSWFYHPKWMELSSEFVLGARHRWMGFAHLFQAKVIQ